jgi:Flp pilus assembly protein TadG
VRKFIDRCRSEDGQSLVELAFVLPLVVLFLFGVIDFGLALNSYNSDTNLANIAAREVAVIGTTSTVTCGGQTYTTLTGYVDCEASVIGVAQPKSVCAGDVATSTTPTSTYAAGDPVKVEITSSFNWMGILTGGDRYIGPIPTSSTLTASATMRMEAAPSGGSSTFLGATACSS